MRSALLGTLIAALIAACSPSPDADLWDCQFSVQKGNAGKDAAAAAERARDIEACMEDRGFRLAGGPACLNGATDATCYRPK
jgi:hypothetical protein